LSYKRDSTPKEVISNNIKDGGSGLEYLDLNEIINSSSLRSNSSLILSIVD